MISLTRRKIFRATVNCNATGYACENRAHAYSYTFLLTSYKRREGRDYRAMIGSCGRYREMSYRCQDDLLALGLLVCLLSSPFFLSRYSILSRVFFISTDTIRVIKLLAFLFCRTKISSIQRGKEQCSPNMLQGFREDLRKFRDHLILPLTLPVQSFLEQSGSLWPGQLWIR